MTFTFWSFTFVCRPSSLCLLSSLKQRAAFRTASGVLEDFFPGSCLDSALYRRSLLVLVDRITV